MVCWVWKPNLQIVGYGNPTHAGLDWRGLKSRLRPWKSAQADSDRVGFNRLACFEQGIYPRRNQWKCWVRKHLSGVIPIPPLVLSGMETRPMPVWIGGDSSPASDHGSPLKRTQTQTDSVSTDLHALSRGFIPGEISRNVGYGDICRAGFQSRHLCCRVWKPDPCRFGLAGIQVPP